MLAEAGRGEAVSVEYAHLPVDPVPAMSVAFDPVDDGGHRSVVTLEDLLPHFVATNGEEHGYGLGR